MPEYREDLILGDGTILENSHCGYSDRYLWCFISGKTMLECVQIFSDSEKIAEMKSHYLFNGYLYKGFTDLLLVEKNTDGSINVRLTWPEGGEHSVEKLEELKDE